MGCFTVLKSKKKKNEQPIFNKPNKLLEASPTVLPEPQNQSRSLQSAPPSFRTRTAKPVQPVTRATGRTRALSAPSSLHVAERDALSAAEYDEQEDAKSRGGPAKDQWISSPQPLPLPSPQGAAALKHLGSFKSSTASGPIFASGPLPLPPLGGLRNFSYDEIATACQHFSPERCMSEGLSSTFYKASFGDETSGAKKLEATVTRLLPTAQTQSMKEFVNEINALASLQHPQLCKLIGYHAREGSDQRMLVYERLFHGSLDRLLYGRSDGLPIDWYARTKLALSASQGLAFLHEEGPFQAMFYEFSTANIQVDKDFSAKLSGYGCVHVCPEVNATNASTASANLPEETTERGLLTPKSNVWCFGIVLLELLTGRRHLDIRHPKEERNLIKWSRPFLADDSRLSLIMDPRLKGRFPAKAARAVADVAQKCLQKDPSDRPTMRSIVESLKNIQDMKYSCRFPLQEPATIAGKQMLSCSTVHTHSAHALHSPDRLPLLSSMGTEMVMVAEIPFLPQITSPKPMTLIGHGITDIEIHFLQIKFTAIGVYVEPQVVEHLQQWKGKIGSQLAEDDSFFKALVSAPVEKLVRVVVIKEIKGSQYGVQLESAVRDRLAAIDKYEEEEEEAVEKIVHFFQSKYLKTRSVITFAFTSRTAEVGLSSTGEEEEEEEEEGGKEEAKICIKVENENVAEAIQGVRELKQQKIRVLMEGGPR
ncbi:hypothetical protein H6P81_016812 [Aristolochia fimbriata]|uniref:Chalcone-flavonone isomerase family protein n=1 Tax=Aristolochia fimbriata TaxID=158543 RepID=A0AAV7ECL5_ARIFI|nr:hypothetical protein H6P81_016812 [Aristolochia fimbriata]